VDLTDLQRCARLEGRALHPLDALLAALRLQQPEAGDQLLGLRERTVDDRALAARAEAEARALGGRVQPLGREHDTGLDHLLVEPAHRGEGLLVLRLQLTLGLCRSLHNHHETHRRSPCLGLVCLTL
jgi:GNAT superfamily N-acetyltransferase